MPPTLQPFLLKDVSLTLKKVGAVTEPVEYRCQLSRAALVPTAATGGGSSLSTFCEDYSDAGGMATWALSVGGFQALADAQDFSVLSFNEEGEKFDFVLAPLGGPPTAATPAFEGQVTMAATPIGGDAKTWAVWTADLPCVSKPVMVTAEVFV